MAQPIGKVREYLANLEYYEESVAWIRGKEHHYFRRREQDVYEFGIVVQDGEISDVMWEMVRAMAAINEQDKPDV